MSTRATYHFTEQHLTFYVHMDGYLAGAACKFLDMLRQEEGGDGYAGAFYRANLRAQHTTDWRDHGDTEYRYDLNSRGILTAHHRQAFAPSWEMAYCGPLHDFINSYHPVDWEGHPKEPVVMLVRTVSLPREHTRLVFFPRSILERRILAKAEEMGKATNSNVRRCAASELEWLLGADGWEPLLAPELIQSMRDAIEAVPLVG